MEFLDPKKLRAHQIRLMIGYAMVATAIILAAILLLYQAKGFSVRQGKVVQNGLVFVESAAGTADIRLNNRLTETTNARLVLEAGSYVMKLSRDGYVDWQRALTVEGGSVQHFTYPWLMPKQLQTSTISTYQAAPALVTQSPDRRWLMVSVPGQLGVFDVYDLKDPLRVQALRSSLTIPDNLYRLTQEGSRSLELVEWSNDNDHVLLRHSNGDQSEYLMVSRTKPAESVNVSQALSLQAGQVPMLVDKKFDRYFVHDTARKTLTTASLSAPQPTSLLDNVLTYKSYGTDTVLYASAIEGRTDRVDIRLLQDDRQYTVRSVAAGDTYGLGLSRYDDAWYAMVADAAEGRTYIYRNPATALARDDSRPAVPVAVLKVAKPATVAFSTNSQLMLAQNGTDFAVYDAEYDRSHTYRMDLPLDQPQAKVSWIDGYHLQYVSAGKVVIFDYDGTNIHSLAAQNPGLPPVYNGGYNYLYTLAKPATPGAIQEAHVLSSTPLRTPADL